VRGENRIRQQIDDKDRQLREKERQIRKQRKSIHLLLHKGPLTTIADEENGSSLYGWLTSSQTEAECAAEEPEVANAVDPHDPPEGDASPEGDAYQLMTDGVITQEEYEQLLAVELKAAYELMQQGVITMDEYEQVLSVDASPEGDEQVLSVDECSAVPTGADETVAEAGREVAEGGREVAEGGGDSIQNDDQEDSIIVSSLRRASAWFSTADFEAVDAKRGEKVASKRGAQDVGAGAQEVGAQEWNAHDGYESESISESWKQQHRRQIAKWKKSHAGGTFAAYLFENFAENVRRTRTPKGGGGDDAVQMEDAEGVAYWADKRIVERRWRQVFDEVTVKAKSRRRTAAEAKSTGDSDGGGDDVFSTFRRVSAAVLPGNLSTFTPWTDGADGKEEGARKAREGDDHEEKDFELIPEGMMAVVTVYGAESISGDSQGDHVTSGGLAPLAVSMGLASVSAPFVAASLNRIPPHHLVATSSARTLPASAEEDGGEESWRSRSDDADRTNPQWTKTQRHSMCLHCERHTHALELEIRSYVQHALPGIRRDHSDSGGGQRLSVVLGRTTVLLRKLKPKRTGKRDKLQRQVRSLQRRLSSIGIEDADETGGAGRGALTGLPAPIVAADTQNVDVELGASSEGTSSEDSEEEDEDAVSLCDGSKRWFPLDTGGQLRGSVRLCMPVSARNVRLGLRVQRGPHWTQGDQDGGAASLGTVVGYNSDSADGTGHVKGVYPKSLPPLHAVVKWDRPPLDDSATAGTASSPGGEGGGARSRRAPNAPVSRLSAGLCAFYSIGYAGKTKGDGAFSRRKGKANGERHELAIPNRKSGGRGETEEEEALAASTVALERHMMEEKKRSAMEMRQVKGEAQAWLKETKRMSAEAHQAQLDASKELQLKAMRAAEAEAALREKISKVQKYS
jgi:hypothetical protein